MGVLSWMSHVLVWREDAARLDAADQPTPFFQWEVGFANGAFALAGLLAVVFDWGVGALAAVVLGCAMYLLQAGLLNGRRYFSGQSRTPARLRGSFIGNSALAVMVGVVAFWALSDAASGRSEAAGAGRDQGPETIPFSSQPAPDARRAARRRARRQPPGRRAPPSSAPDLVAEDAAGYLERQRRQQGDAEDHPRSSSSTRRDVR